MADIELVIKISEKTYAEIMAKDATTRAEAIICNGTVLPKGHDRLIDAKDYAESILKHYFDNSTVIRCTEIALDNAPTIVEADKESE